jgi:hypothetical protein
MFPGLLGGFSGFGTTLQQNAQQNMPLLLAAGGMMSQGHPLAGGFTGLAQGAQQQFRNDLLTQEQQRLAQAQALRDQIARQGMGLAGEEAQWAREDRTAASAAQTAARNASIQYAVNNGLAPEQAQQLADAGLLGDYVGETLKRSFPGERKYEKDQSGNYRWLDTGEPVFPGATTLNDADPSLPTDPTEREEFLKTRGKKTAEAGVQLQTNADGAEAFLRKVEAAKAAATSAGDNVFGGMDAWDVTQGIRREFNPTLASARDKLDAELSKLELDVAKMNFQGQGAVTENERLLARKTLGGAGVTDTATQISILDSLKGEAIETLRRAGRSIPGEAKDYKASTTAETVGEETRKANTRVFNPETGWFDD